MAKVEVTVTADRRGDVSLTVDLSLHLSPWSNSFRPPSVVIQVTMATLGHRAAGAHSGMSFFLSLFLCSHTPSVCVFIINMEWLSISLFAVRRLFHFVSSHLALRVVLCTPSLCLSLFCLLFVSRCLSQQSCSRVVESWQSWLSLSA